MVLLVTICLIVLENKLKFPDSETSDHLVINASNYQFSMAYFSEVLPSQCL